MGKKIEGDRVYAAGTLLFRHRDSWQFLLMKHPKRWDLPKGHAEPGESAIETALRETEEETGIDRHHLWIDPEFRFRIHYPVTYKKRPGQVFDKHVSFFLARLESECDIMLTEHPECQWFDWQPPHEIQEQTIDPLLAAVAEHFASGHDQLLQIDATR